MASQLLVDLYNCDKEIINDMEKVKNIARIMIKEIGAEIVEECFHKFQPIGITYIAVITTSHFSIHTWPEYGYVAVDIFSCKKDLPNQVALKLQKAFGSTKYIVKEYERNVGRGA